MIMMMMIKMMMKMMMMMQVWRLMRSSEPLMRMTACCPRPRSAILMAATPAPVTGTAMRIVRSSVSTTTATASSVTVDTARKVNLSTNFSVKLLVFIIFIPIIYLGCAEDKNCPFGLPCTNHICTA